MRWPVAPRWDAHVATSSAEPTLWDMSLDMIATANPLGFLTRLNPVWEETLGLSSEELMGCPFIEFVHPDDVERTTVELAAVTGADHPWIRFENRFRASDGEYRWLSWSCLARDGVTMYAVVRDVTVAGEAERERERLYGQLREREQLLDGVVENAPIGMAVTALYGKVLRVNRALREITGRSKAELVELSSLDDITHPDDVQDRGRELRTLGSTEASTYRRVKRLLHARGHVVWVESSSSLVCDAHGDPLHMVVQVQDISVRKSLEERLQYYADVDTLTGMRNRRTFEEDLRTQVARCRRYGDHAALLVLDLDGFKEINDTYGHKTGDDVLKAVAAALKSRVRSGDLAARLGGDEFAVLLSNVTPAGAGAAAAELQQVVLEATVSVGDEVIHTGVSVGVAIIDDHSTDREAVLAAADASMYVSKRAAKRAGTA